MDKITKIIAKMIFAGDARSSFFCNRLMRLDRVVDPNFPTMATDGKCLFYPQAMVDSLSDNHLETVLVHEAMHVCLDHHRRMLSYPNIDEQTLNLAADFAVNSILEDCGYSFPARLYGKPIKAAFPQDCGFPKLLSFDEYLKLLMGQQREEEDGGSGKQEGNGKPDGKGKGQPGIGDVMPAPDGLKDPTPEEIVSLTQDALAASMKKGELPGFLKRIIDNLPQNRPTSWRQIMRDYVGRAMSGELRTWVPPKRRMIQSGTYLPDFRKGNLKTVCMAIDCSGSVSLDQFRNMMADLRDIFRDFPNSEFVTLYHCVDVFDIREGNELPTELADGAGGGTSHIPVLREAAERDPDLVVCITDMYSEFPKTYDYPVLFCDITGNDKRNPGYGITVAVKE